MNITKINDKKIEIEFDENFLNENKITLHSFLANSTVCKNLANNLLEKNKDQLQITYNDKEVTVQLYYINKQHFIITITNFTTINNTSTTNNISTSGYVIYSFSSIINFKQFLNFINHISISIQNIYLQIYTYQNNIFLIIDQKHLDADFKKLQNILSEFCDSISTSEHLAYKIQECGIIIKN